MEYKAFGSLEEQIFRWRSSNLTVQDRARIDDLVEEWNRQLQGPDSRGGIHFSVPDNAQLAILRKAMQKFNELGRKLVAAEITQNSKATFVVFRLRSETDLSF